MAYEIGYRRPPKSGQFIKGKTGNPKGRPKGSRNFSTLLDQELDQKITVNENGKKRQISRLQFMVKRMVSKAVNGDLKATIHVLDVMRRMGRIEPEATDGFLPDDYESRLTDFVKQHHASITAAASEPKKR